MRDNRNYYSGTNPWGWMGSPMLPWMSLMRAWSDMLCAFTPGCWPQQPQPGYCGPTPGPQTASIVFLVDAKTPVDVSAHINPGAECCELTCDTLKDVKGKGHPIMAQIQSVPGMIRVHLPIGAKQAEGTYRGAIRTTSDATGVGSICVVVKSGLGA